MSKPFRKLLACAAALNCLGCTHPTVPMRAATATYSPSELQSDAARLRSVLTEGHPALRKYRTPGQVDSIFRALEDSLRTPRTAGEFWKLGSIALAGFRDDHTSLLPNSAMFDALYQSPGAALPLRLGVIDGRLYVLRSYLGDNGPVQGSEILAINGSSATEFLADCTRTVPTDGEVALRAIRKVERDFEGTCALSLGMPSEYRMTIREPSGASRSVVVAAIPWRERRKLVRANAPQDTIVPVAGRFDVDSSEVAVLQIHTWSKSDAFDPSRFIEESFRRIKQNPPRALVIDLRGNTGGSDGPAATLYRHIARDTFTYYARREINKRHFDLLKGTDDWMLNYMFWFKPIEKRSDGGYLLRLAMDKVMKPERDAYTGDVYLLIDGNSVSTSSEFASLFKAQARGTILGEESGSALGGGTGATVSVVLPNTGLILNIPLMSARMATLSGTTESLMRGVMPDVPVNPTVSDRLSGRDAVLETALTRARSKTR